ncbi:MAG: 50S ribosomal protein L25, partial [Rickettsiales bacterium]
APEHMDFLQVDENARVKVNVPVLVLNAEKAAGVKMGGSLNMVRHDLELICAPDAIPPVIKIDVAELNIGDSVHISQVTLPSGVESAITDRDFTILTMAGRLAEEVEETEEGAEGEEGAAEAGAAEGGEAAEGGDAEEAKAEE